MSLSSSSSKDAIYVFYQTVIATARLVDDEVHRLLSVNSQSAKGLDSSFLHLSFAKGPNPVISLAISPGSGDQGDSLGCSRADYAP
ncbi:hypothetical protein QVD17_37703 [Tagetes erecta]|uniref:Uncharacterized protein n=1 Tax=Tagetes erecta TaxID=13708 RepID=A0AAD8JWJ3_TARER|nr:hypothetical protein QVD17_37703 [Tagetes erecta]